MRERVEERLADADPEAIAAEDLPPSRIKTMPMGGVSAGMSSTQTESIELDDAGENREDAPDAAIPKLRPIKPRRVKKVGAKKTVAKAKPKSKTAAKKRKPSKAPKAKVKTKVKTKAKAKPKVKAMPKTKAKKR